MTRKGPETRKDTAVAARLEVERNASSWANEVYMTFTVTLTGIEPDGRMGTLPYDDPVYTGPDAYITRDLYSYLRVTAQTDRTHAQEGRGAYAWNVGLYGTVTSRTAGPLYRLLERVDRRVAKVNGLAGEPVTFGQYATRVLTALGVEAAYIPLSEAARERTGRIWRLEPVAEAGRWLDDQDRAFQREAKGEAA